MQYRFSNLDNELKTIQIEQEIFNRTKLTIKKKKENIIYLKRSIINEILKKITNKTIIDTTYFKTSKDYYIGIHEITEEIDCEHDENDEYSYNEELSKEEYFDILLEEINIYYYIYALPNFEISIKSFKKFIFTLYDYISNKNASEIITSVNRYVLAEALVKNKTKITLSNYINQLKYLLLYDFDYEDIKILEEKLNSHKIIEFQKYKKKI